MCFGVFKSQRKAFLCLERRLDAFQKGVSHAVEAVRRTAARRNAAPVAIVASVGPYATRLADGSEYSGSYVDAAGFDRTELRKNYETQVRALRDVGVRYFAFETIPTVLEATFARQTMDEFGVEGWISVTCRVIERTQRIGAMQPVCVYVLQDDEHLAHGDRFADFVRVVSNSPNVRAVGVNCTSPAHIKGLLASGRAHLNGRPFVVYPNSGEIFDTQTRKLVFFASRPI